MKRALTIRVELITKRGKYLELDLPAVKAVCPACAAMASSANCGLCQGRSTVLVLDEEWVIRYPRIDRAMRRWETQERAIAYERDFERRTGC